MTSSTTQNDNTLSAGTTSADSGDGGGVTTTTTSTSVTGPATATASTTNDGVPSRSSSTSQLQLLPTVTVVTPQRKDQLLVQARAERRNWISRVPLPYSSQVRASTRGGGSAGGGGGGDLNDDLWSRNDTLYRVQSSLVCQKYLPSATRTLSELYGLHDASSGGDSLTTTTARSLSLDQVAQRVEKLIEPYDLKQEQSVLKSAPLGPMEASDETGSVVTPPQDGTTTSSDDATKAYYDFWMALLLPESALLVQTMRNFVLNWTTHVLHKSSLTSSAAALNAYIKTTHESIQSTHIAWKDRPKVDSGLALRRSLESFLYGHLHGRIFDRMDPAKRKDDDDDTKTIDQESLFTMNQHEFDARLDEVQFVQPTHLEIACLQDADVDDGSLDTLLKEPIQALLSMDSYFSPYEKLQRILRVYQEVNESLSVALNKNNDQSGGTSTKLPSADDVLPTIILTCIKARPKNLLFDLQFIEVFALPEYLRGEAGYAYTNLYGAVQFLQELDLENIGSGIDRAGSSNTLSISPRDLTLGLDKSRASAKNRHHGLSQARRGVGLSTQGGQIGIDLAMEVPAALLSVRDVRSARMKGETVDLEWATKWQESMVNQKSSQPQEPPVTIMSTVPPLPEGFTRTYTFLGARPEDIRVSDLPQLLEEYKMLAQVTEDLLTERSSRIAAEKKRQVIEKQKALGEQLLLAKIEMGERE